MRLRRPRAPLFRRAAILLAEALEHHRKGRLDEAERLYRTILSADAGHADSLHLLGCLTSQRGDHQAAVELLRQAILLRDNAPAYHNNLGNVLSELRRFDEAAVGYERALTLNPDYAEAHNNLGNVRKAQGRLDDAIESFERALTLNPDYAEAHHNLGNAFNNQGRLDDAVRSYQRAIAIRPDNVEAHNNLGVVHKRRGQPGEAVRSYQRALALDPDYADAHNNLGNALREQGRLGDAVASLERALALKPSFAAAHSNLGNALKEQGRLDDAVRSYQRALAIDPDYADAHYNLGNALYDQGRMIEAAASYQRALAGKPDHADAHNNLGNAFRELGRLEDAADSYARSLALQPDHAEAHNNLGNALKEQGRIDEAVASYRRALALDPDYAGASSNLAFGLHYSDKVTDAELSAAHRDWDERFGRAASMAIAHDNAREAGRRLKIGYVSPDFRQHAVSYFIEPLLREHDRQAVEIYCYADVARPDAVSAQLQGLSDHWAVTVRMSDDALAERIRADGIDILVDLAGHTANHRLRVFARKPAPVQVTWLGYPNSTGLKAIDYRLVDAVTDPPGDADARASETLVRVEGGFLCYAPSQDAPEPKPPPCLTAGAVTFGSFNNPAKLSPATLATWGSLLRGLPQARLLLKGKPFGDAATRALFLSRLGQCGVGAERVEMVAWVPGEAAHLALYDRVDIALDPFPYNGTTTTCEALWMGVPVVTLRGERHSGRVGASLLTQVGLTDWIAGSAEEYVRIAATLAAEPEQLKEWRGGMRARVKASPLCAARGFSRKIEAAYRAMWQRWCGATSAEQGRDR